MFIIDGILNCVSVAPDSFSPLKHMSALNLIVWLALSLFIFENVLIMFFQYTFEYLSKFTIMNFSGISTTMINKIFTCTAFPLLYIQLIKPFSGGLYKIAFIFIMIYGVFVAFINGILSLFTKKRINI
tara:strand:- start:2397 stop:2780 length:384 start_codon:yes stop_codon:yes gene_type:complete